MAKVVWDTMVDLETYSNLPTSAIASIGAVRFNIATREIQDEFYVTVDPATSKQAGLHFSKETLDWWKTQNPLAWKALRVNNIPLIDALVQFNDWFDPKGKICCWGQFDVPVLDYAYHQVKMPSPWKFWNTVECRTIADLLGKKIDRSAGTHHNALDDAKAQAKFMIDILNPVEN